MNSTVATVAASSSVVRTCHLGGILQPGDHSSTLTVRADPILSDGSSLNSPENRHILRALRTTVDAVANEKRLTLSRVSDVEFELTGSIMNVLSATAIVTLISHKVMERLPQSRGAVLRFAVCEVHAQYKS